MKDINTSFAAIEVLPIPVLVFAPAPKLSVLACSKAFLPFSRWKKETIVGKNCHDVFIGPSIDWKELMNTIGDSVGRFLDLLDKDGNHLRFEAQISNVFNQVGEVDYMVCSFLVDLHKNDDNNAVTASETEVVTRISDRLLPEVDIVLESLLTSVQGIVWEADPNTFQTLFISAHVYNILGYTPEQWLSEPNFWINSLYPADKKKVLDYGFDQLKTMHHFSIDYRIRAADGRLVWIEDVITVIKEGDKPARLQGVMIDISSSKRLEELNRLERKILEMNTKSDGKLLEVVYNYMVGVEHIYSNMHCSLHQIVDNKLTNGIAPSLPKSYLAEIDSLVIGPLVGSCGTAAYYKKRVVVQDIANDERWSKYKEIPLKYNLLACWSNPVLDSQGEVMAVFGIYYNTVKEPTEEELIVIDRCTELFRIVLENENKTKLLQESYSLMGQVQEMAHFGNWQWDVASNIVKWSDELYRIYGLSKEGFAATFEAYQELIYAEDRARVMEQIQYVLHWKRDGMFEERIIRPDGDMRFLKSWCRVELNDKGVPVRLFGACLDITKNKRTQKRLQASEARLRNLVDSQTNYVIRTDLEGRYSYYNNKYFEDYGWLFEGKEIIGQSPVTIILPAYYQTIADSVTRCLEAPYNVVSVEFNTRSRSGPERATYWHFKALLNAEGEPEEIQCIGVDITDRKLAEDSLRISNERYEYVNKATNDAIYDWDITNDHVEWGEGYTRLFGYALDLERYPVVIWERRLHALDRSSVLSDLRKALDNSDQHSWLRTYRYLKLDGQYAYVQSKGYIIRDSEGQAIRMIGVLSDMTSLKKEKQRLELVESVISKARDLVIIAEVCSEGPQLIQVMYANNAFPFMKGYIHDDLGGTTHFLDMSYTQVKDVQVIEKALREGQALQLDLLQHNNNGTPFWMSLSIHPIWDHADRISHWIFIGQDVTQRRVYVDAIEQQNEKLRSIAFLQSHVVRAPLARLMGLIDLLKNYENSELENKQILEYLINSAQELDGIIREISGKTSIC